MSLCPPVELDPTHRRAWDRDGFLILRKFFEKDDVQELIDAMAQRGLVVDAAA